MSLPLILFCLAIISTFALVFFLHAREKRENERLRRKEQSVRQKEANNLFWKETARQNKEDAA
jgi:hypothetical protein